MSKEKELLYRYNMGERNFSGQELRKLKINKRFHNSYYGESINLSNANFSQANLEQAIFSYANLAHTNFSNARLVGANFCNAILTESNFDNANLVGVNLAGARLENASFKNANLTDTILDWANFTDANLTGANLTRAKMFRTNFTNAINAPKISSIFQNSSNSRNLKLLNELKQATKELFHSSEADSPYEIYLWEKEIMGEFNLEKLLMAFGYFREICLEPFINGNLQYLKTIYPSIQQEQLIRLNAIIKLFNKISSKINAYLNNIKILSLGRKYMILAIMPSGNWVGITIKSLKHLADRKYHFPLSKSIHSLFSNNLVINTSDDIIIIEWLKNIINEIKTFFSIYRRTFYYRNWQNERICYLPTFG